MIKKMMKRKCYKKEREEIKRLSNMRDALYATHILFVALSCWFGYYAVNDLINQASNFYHTDLIILIQFGGLSLAFKGLSLMAELEAKRRLYNLKEKCAERARFKKEVEAEYARRAA